MKNGYPATILTIDDNALIRKSLRAYLEDIQFRVLEAVGYRNPHFWKKPENFVIGTERS